MLQNISIEQIVERAEAVGLSRKALARKAGVDPMTVKRGVEGRCETRNSNIRKLLGAVEAKEAELRQHLAAVERPQTGRAA